MEYSRRFQLLREALSRAAAPKYRLDQIIHQLYKKKVSRVADLKSIGTQTQQTLEKHFGLDLLTLKCASVADAPRAKKFLFRCDDDVKIETTALRFPTHTSLCISSQAGCSFNCSFCATGKIGLKRQLTVDEITDQVLYAQANGMAPDSISFMGMGEPLANPRVFEALHLLTDPRAFGMSARRLNISTSGVLPGIKRLNEQHPQVNLAFSLHSPFPEERNALVPANRLYPFPEVFELLDERLALTGRRVWIAYLLLKDCNDSREHAKELASLIRERRRQTRHLYHVSLIEYNDVSVSRYELSDAKGVSPTVRRAGGENLKLFEPELQGGF
ncbi:hypothetical protein Esti_005300 [Eimeria stiedai]